MQSESAVVSITFNPRSIACKWVSSRDQLRVRVHAGIAVEHALDAVLRHQDRLGADLERAERCGRVRREVRVPGAGGEDDDAALLEMAHGAPADVRLRDFLHVDRREHARVRAVPLERLLDGERVQHRREHAHVVAGRAVDPLLPPPPCRGRCCPPPITSAISEPARTHVRQLGRELVDGAGVEPVLLRAHQSLAGELQENAAEGSLPTAYQA